MGFAASLRKLGNPFRERFAPYRECIPEARYVSSRDCLQRQCLILRGSAVDGFSDWREHSGLLSSLLLRLKATDDGDSGKSW